jgi:glycerophosphoryl diester phosphodiesterase
MPRVSANYKNHLIWQGKGRMPEDEFAKLEMLVDSLHANGLKIRFWAVPDRPAVWQMLLDAGVDWISVDHLQKFRDFYEVYSRNVHPIPGNP